MARFLRDNNYEQTLATFLEEAGLPPETGASTLELRDENWTIEKIMEEKNVFDKSLAFERVARGEGQDGWKIPGEWLVFATIRFYGMFSISSYSFSSFRNYPVLPGEYVYFVVIFLVRTLYHTLI